MIEVGVVVARGGGPLYWHRPTGSTSTALPDSTFLWNVLWENRDDVLGFAHSHPGNGLPQPSWTDLTTFAAIESGLGRRLQWWITSFDHLGCFTWLGPGAHDYQGAVVASDLPWLQELRRRSYTSC